MRMVVQRVSEAKVIRIKDGEVVGKIGLGLFVLLGIKKGDTEKEAVILSDKITKLRVMSDELDKMNLSVGDVGGKILVVSQFTLYADTSGGNRPSFVNAEAPQKAKVLYEYFVDQLRKKEIKVETGSFGEYMKIETVMDGPVTIIYE
jgi:D-tyrosyl-tRNA(Tyr) deacylase